MGFGYGWTGTSLLSFQFLFDRLASSELKDFFRRQELKDALLDKLKIKLLALNAMLDDAEEKEMTNHAVKLFHDELKHAVFQAEQLLDEIETEALSCEKEVESHIIACKSKIWNLMSSCVTNVNPFARTIESRIIEITEKLELFAQEKDVLGLKDPSVGKASTRSQTTSLVDTSDVFGRDKDKEDIIRALTSDDMNSNSIACGVITIVGLGGMGKTTLAQMIYNDERANEYFERKSWIYVSEDFDVSIMTGKILESVSPEACETYNLDLLQVKLKECLVTRRFLLVLDDVWSESFQEWEALYRPLKSGAQGSKISLFARQAFRPNNPNPSLSLQAIGEKIVKKCDGLPLAKMLGSLLHSNLDEEEWNSVLRSNVWGNDSGNILPALRLSYKYLFPQLKRCFAYCSIFPKGFKFAKFQLESRETVGYDYFDQLLSISFFQKSSDSDFWFVMHDLINDLACFVSREFSLRLENNKPKSVSKKLWHLSYFKDWYNTSQEFAALYDAESLCTSVSFNRPSNCKSCYLGRHVLHDLLPSLKCLRTLFLCYYNINELPDEIGQLKQLRFLDLSHTTLKQLPESTTKLQNRTNLNMMPIGLSKMSSLQSLSAFYVAKHGGSRLGELKNLCLGKSLGLLNLQNIGSSMEALEANLKNKNLDELALLWGEETEDSQEHMVVLENLQPNTNLRRLIISNYIGSRFPDWIGHSSYANMVCLHLSCCKNCFFLPPLGQLPFLEALYIDGMRGVKRVGPKFNGYRPSTESFPSLKTLSFLNMLEWEEWISCGGEGGQSLVLKTGMPLMLESLIICNCPSLKSFPRKGLPTTLKVLAIGGCQSLSIKIEEMEKCYPSVQDWSISGGCCPLWSHSLEFFPKLKRLSLRDCPSIDSLSMEVHHETHFSYLCFLRTDNCPNFVSFPKIGLPAPHLTKPYLKNCKSLKSLPKHLHIFNKSLEELLLSDCPEIESFPQGGLPTNLRFLRIHGCLHCLQTLQMGGCEDLVSFPVGWLQPSNLTTLSIHNLSKITSLDHMELQDLTSFRELYISNCPNLRTLSKGVLPTSLSILAITNSVLLEQQCQKRKGKQ
ncbi:hypothetical protein NMG60_11009619 [Bertholletia excelsa]